MKNTGKKALALVAASSMVLGAVGAVPAVAADASGAEALPSGAVSNDEGVENAQVSVDRVVGAFAFTQSAVAGNDTIANTFRKASAYLCGSYFEPLLAVQGQATEGVSAGEVVVKGTVNHQLSVNLEERAAEEGDDTIMGCSCSGDSIDGSSHANAHVHGVTLRSLLDEAQVQPGTDTIVFTAADGYEVALPLTYVMQRYSILVTEVNGQPVSEVMGGANQLWLGSTAARSYVRDVQTITLEARDVAPQAPGFTTWDAENANTPHISLSEGSVA